MAHDRETHALIRNQPWSGRSSQTPGFQKNPDGSVDVYFGPKSPAGPEKPLFDKTWTLPDVEPMK